MHYQTSVRTDADYADIPEAAKFSIDEANAKSIVRLAGLVKANNLHCLEQFDNSVDWDWGEEEGSTEAERLVVFADAFCFSAWVKHTNVEIRTKKQPIAELARHYRLEREGMGSSEEAFEKVASKAQDAFWSSIVATYPMVKTGDFSPLATISFDDACKDAALAWLASNLPVGARLRAGDGNVYEKRTDGRYTAGDLELDSLEALGDSFVVLSGR